MINRRIDVCAVVTGEQVMICTAPYLSAIYPGDTVEIEGVDGFGKVLICGGSIIYGGEDFLTLDESVLVRKILKKVTFDPMKWDGYEEGNNE